MFSGDLEIIFAHRRVKLNGLVGPDFLKKIGTEHPPRHDNNNNNNQSSLLSKLINIFFLIKFVIL